MMDTFSRQLSDFLRFYVNSVSYAYFFWIFCFCSNLENKFTNEFSRCRNGSKHSLAPKNGGEAHFKRQFCFYWGLKLTLVSVSFDKDVVPPNCVNNVLHIVVAF